MTGARGDALVFAAEDHLEGEPKVFDYLDAVSYLQDYHKWRKATRKDFSYESWSEELHFNSRSYIRMMTMGKAKISHKFVQAFSQLRFAQADEEEYFAYLVQYSQARNQKDKKAFGAKLIEILKKRTTQTLMAPQPDFLSNPQLPRLYTLLGFKDITPTSDHLARLMRLPESDVQFFLQKLEEMGLARRSLVEQEIHWMALHQRFKVPDDKGNLNLLKFHELSLAEAITAFDQPKNERKYKSLILPLSEEELAELSAAVDSFCTEQVARYSPAKYHTRKLFQLNLNFYNVAQNADEVRPTSPT